MQLKKLRKPSPAMVVACIALAIALSGASYAAVKLPRNSVGTAQLKANAVTSAKVKNASLRSADFAAGQLPAGPQGPPGPANPNADTLDGIDSLGFLQTGAAAGGDLSGAFGNLQLGPGVVTSAEVLDDTQVGGGLQAADLQSNSVGQPEIATDGVAALEIQDNSIDSGEIVDFQLTNQDIGVLFAQVNADATIANSSGGVTGTKVATGQYAVDFGRNISTCAYVITQGEAGAGAAGGAITGATDRSGNVEAVFATTRTEGGVLADRAFQLVVVC